MFKLFLIKAWRVIKPVNKIHIAAYVFYFYLAAYELMVLPQPESIEHYKKVEGFLVEYVYHRGGPRSSGGYFATIYLKDKKQVVKLKHSEGNKSYKAWLKKPVVAYYWPSRWFGVETKMVFFSSLNTAKDDLSSFIENDGFKQPNLIWDVKYWIYVYLFILWMVPFLWRLNNPLKQHKNGLSPKKQT